MFLDLTLLLDHKLKASKDRLVFPSAVAPLSIVLALSRPEQALEGRRTDGQAGRPGRRGGTRDTDAFGYCPILHIIQLSLSDSTLAKQSLILKLGISY